MERWRGERKTEVSMGLATGKLLATALTVVPDGHGNADQVGMVTE